MTRTLFGICVIMYFTSCCSQEMPKSEEFNKIASKTILKNFGNYDLAPLDNVEKCVLEKVIANDLDLLNDFQISQINDRFLIKSFYENRLRLQFSFIEDVMDKTNYFVCVPSLDKFIFSLDPYYKQKNDSVFVYNGRSFAVKLNAPLIDTLFCSSGFQINVSDEKDFYRKRKMAKNILQEVFPSLYKDEFSGFPGALQKQLSAGIISKNEFDEGMRIFNPNFNYNVDVCFLDYAGFFFVVYHLDKKKTHLAVDLYFIPNKTRRKLLFNFEPSDYLRDCRIQSQTAK